MRKSRDESLGTCLSPRISDMLLASARRAEPAHVRLSLATNAAFDAPKKHRDRCHELILLYLRPVLRPKACVKSLSQAVPRPLKCRHEQLRTSMPWLLAMREGGHPCWRDGRGSWTPACPGHPPGRPDPPSLGP